MLARYWLVSATQYSNSLAYSDGLDGGRPRPESGGRRTPNTTTAPPYFASPT